MPIHLMSRRSFLRSVAGGTAAIVIPGCSRFDGTTRASQDASQPVEWALLSDTHVSEDRDKIVRGGNISERLQRVVADIIAHRRGLAGVIIDGDLAFGRGLPGDYAVLSELLEPLRQADLDLHLILGNHDNRENALAALGQPLGAVVLDEPRRISVVDTGPVRLIMLDSLIKPDHTPGRLGDIQRRWLAETLKQTPDRPCFLFLHHVIDFDGKNLKDDAEFMEIVKANPQVKIVFQGHTHTYRYRNVEGIHFVELPPTGYAFDDQQPIGWVRARFDAQSCNLTLHALDGNKQKHLQTRHLETGT